MMITTTNSIPQVQWREVEMLGMVSGSVVRGKYAGKDKTGAEIQGYTKALGEARELAVSRMVTEAEALGATAVVKVAYTTTPLEQGAVEVVAYGTAVRYDPAKSDDETNHATKNIRNPARYEYLGNTSLFSDSKNILNISYAQEKALKRAIEKSDVKRLLEKIHSKNNDLSYELQRIHFNKEHIDNIYEEIGELTVLFGELGFIESAAKKDLKAIIAEKICVVEEAAIRKDNL